MDTQNTEPAAVLVIDDEVTVCRSVEKILTRSGHRVVCTTSVAAALDVLESGTHVKLVFADLMMPGVSGLEFIRVSAQRWPHLPVVVITGFASVSTAVEAARLGAVDYLAKPFTPSELEATVARAISRGTWKPRLVREARLPGARPEAPVANIDVDMPFDPEEVARATSPQYVKHLTRSDVPILDFCELGQRSCKRFVTKGICQKGECPIVAAERKRGRKTAAALVDDAIDVDLPFSAREVAAITGPSYVRALGRGDLPVTGRWPHDARRARRILAVDDEPVVVHAIRRSLQGRGYRIEEAFSGRAALARVAAEKYDLVLLDMRMPDLNGLDVLPRIHQCQPDLPVVIVTGYASIETAVEAIRNGAADYLPKPFTPEELRRTADRMLQRAA